MALLLTLPAQARLTSAAWLKPYIRRRNSPKGRSDNLVVWVSATCLNQEELVVIFLRLKSNSFVDLDICFSMSTSSPMHSLRHDKYREVLHIGSNPGVDEVAV